MARHASEPASRYEVRQVEAWAGDEVGLWTWNQSFHLGDFYTRRETRAGIARAFTKYLKTKHKITFKHNRTLIVGNFDILEIVDRKTKEPLFAAIWNEN